MIRHISNYNESWKTENWKQHQKNVFRLQMRIYKAVRNGDMVKARNLQKLLMRSFSARMMAIRQVTQLNAGKKTAGIDGTKSLDFKQRYALEQELADNADNWKHSGLREIPIPKKNGKKRILKVPTIKDRAWQCLVKLCLDPAHEATFHSRSYGFRVGRSAHDAQKFLFHNLRSQSNGINKRVIELDIEKCFDTINHSTILDNMIAPQCIKQGTFRCLKAGVNPEFPNQGTPQGGVISPLLANIALNGIEDIHNSVRYADDMVIVLKPEDNAEHILDKINSFLANKGMKISNSKTKVSTTTDGFDFLGWHFKVQSNGKFRSTPSEDNFRTFRKKVKEIINSSNYGAEMKAIKLAPIVRGWRNYHKHCNMNSAKYSLWHITHRAFMVFNRQAKLNRYSSKKLIERAFPTTPFSENRYVNVKGDYSPYNGDMIYWSKRNSKLYDNHTARALKRQNHSCGHCGLKLIDGERVHLHHIDGNHDNWKTKNLIAVHESCHDYIHMSKREPNPN